MKILLTDSPGRALRYADSHNLGKRFEGWNLVRDLRELAGVVGPVELIVDEFAQLDQAFVDQVTTVISTINATVPPAPAPAPAPPPGP